MEREFDVGDKVVIPRLNTYSDSEISFLSQMKRCIGCPGTVIGKTKLYGDPVYHVEFCLDRANSMRWHLYHKWLEPFIEPDNQFADINVNIVEIINA